MPDEDLSTQFTPLQDPRVKSTALFSHKVALGTLRGSSKIWVGKEMDDPSSAQRELLSQEFFRLIIPHQPETRLLKDTKTGINYIFSEQVRGYRPLPENKAHLFADSPARYTGFGQALVVSLYLREIDLKNGNIGLDNQSRVIKIDGDWAFASETATYFNAQFSISPKTIASLPYPQDFYAFNWLDLIRQEVAHPTSTIVNEQLIDSSSFRQEINEAILKICLLPDQAIINFVDAYCPAGANRFIDCLANWRDSLKSSALEDPSFQAYLSSPQALQTLKDMEGQLNSFTINGASLVFAEDINRTLKHDLKQMQLDAIDAQERQAQILSIPKLIPESVVLTPKRDKISAHASVNDAKIVGCIPFPWKNRYKVTVEKIVDDNALEQSETRFDLKKGWRHLKEKFTKTRSEQTKTEAIEKKTNDPSRKQ